jgi:hypothetical protein
MGWASARRCAHSHRSAAIGSILAPWLVFVLLCACVVAIGVALLGLSFGDIFKTINESLMNIPQ